MRFVPGSLLLILLTHGPPSARSLDYVTNIEPILAAHCVACHGPDSAEGGLRLDSRAIVLRGGDSGIPAVVPHDPSASRLWQAIRGDEEFTMPPEDSGSQLSEAERDTIRQWIADGAPWPDAVAGYDPIAEANSHWSFQPITATLPTAPATAVAIGHTRDRPNGTPSNNIDAFVREQLATRDLSWSPPAARAVFLRRLYLDVLGVPPEWHEVTAFTEDTRPDAKARCVERVLADPRYGERWAQHWLDVVRYADTDGFEVNTPRANAWPYRDYVIRAFNRDTPYDQFLREQLLGDQLGVDPATGFLVCAAALLPGQIGQDDLSKEIARQDELDEIVSGACSTILGLTVGCARCHHHKFDPIRQSDYYALQAIFAGVHFGERTWSTDTYRRVAPALLEQRDQLRQQLYDWGMLPAVVPEENVERFPPRLANRIRFHVFATNSLEPCIDELQVFRAAAPDSATSTQPDSESQPRVNVALASLGAQTRSSGNLAGTKHQLAYINDGEFGNASSWISDAVGGGWVEIELPQAEYIDEIRWGRDRTGNYRDRLATVYQIDIARVVDPTTAVPTLDDTTLIPSQQDSEWETIAASDLRLDTAGINVARTLTLLQDRAMLRTHAPSSNTDVAAEVDDPATSSAPIPLTAANLDSHLSRYRELNRQLEALRADLPGPVFAGQFEAPHPIHVLRRGDVQQPQELARPNCPELFGDLQLTPEASDVERRQRFVDWLLSDDNPLTARVIANRVWQYHFGVGLVDTPSDLGAMGNRPTHPRLLDYLAYELRSNGWSLKHLHRIILLSHTYGQDNAPDPAALAVDADNRLLWRFSPRRMEAEALRDSLLVMSQELNPRVGGPGFDFFQSRGGLSGFPPIDTFDVDGLRRMVYAHKVRMERVPVFGAFDCPDAGQSCPKRTRSTTALQALNLLNSPFMLQRAEHFAERVRREAGADEGDQVRFAFQLTYGRSPSPEEYRSAVSLVAQYGLTMLSRALFNTNEFLLIP